MSADANANSRRSRHFRELSIPLVGLCVLCCCASAPTVWAGEKIKITGPEDKVSLPKDSDNELIPTGPELFRSHIPNEAGQGPSLPQPRQPVLVPNRRMEELLDQRKNWMFTSPRDMDRDKAIKEIFGVRDYDFDGLNKRPKTVMERQFEGDKARLDKLNRSRNERPELDGTTPETAATRPGFDPTERYGGLDEKGDRAIIPELNPAYLFNSPLTDENTSTFGTVFGRSSFLPSGLPNPTIGSRVATPGAAQDAQPQRDFQTLWDSQKTPFGRIADPINDPIDATRSVMNPFAVKKPTVPTPTTVQSSGGEPLGFGSSLPSASRPDLFGPSSFRGPAAPTYTPPAPAPASAPSLLSKPAVLEIPRPRF